MADVTPLLIEGRSNIVSYGGGGFRLSSGGDGAEGRRVEGPLIIMPSGDRTWGEAGMHPEGLEALRQALIGEHLEVLLIGCGERVQFIPPAERQLFRDMGIVIDAMDTGAACRTFNVLMTEDRRAAAALLPVA